MTHQVTVRFVGICTHISQATLPALPAKQRVVLVNARNGRLVRDMPVVRHTPGLMIGPEQVELLGCTVRLATQNSSSLPWEIEKTFHELPNLTKLVQGVTTLGGPSAEVVLDANLEHSACYFDIDFGRLSACRDQNGAAVTTLEVVSPEPISLEIEPWSGSSVRKAGYPLPSGSIVWVGNVDNDPLLRGDDLPTLRRSNEFPFRDFLLHYLTAAKMPHVPQLPQAILLPQCPFHNPMATVGVGCSNSNYP